MNVSFTTDLSRGFCFGNGEDVFTTGLPHPRQNSTETHGSDKTMPIPRSCYCTFFVWPEIPVHRYLSMFRPIVVPRHKSNRQVTCGPRPNGLSAVTRRMEVPESRISIQKALNKDRESTTEKQESGSVIGKEDYIYWFSCSAQGGSHKPANQCRVLSARQLLPFANQLWL